MKFLALLGLSCIVAAQTVLGGGARLLPENGNCVYTNTGLFRSWPASGPRELWRLKIGDGKAAVIEADGRAFTAYQENGWQWAACLEPATGKILWKRPLIERENHHHAVGPVTSPIVDNDRVYFIPYDSWQSNYWYPQCPVFCLRVKDGSEVWHETTNFFNTEGSTPLIISNTLYMGSSGKSNIVVAVDKMTGKLLWKTVHDSGSQYVYQVGASLSYAEFGGIPQVVASIWTNDIIGVSLKDGQVLWKWGFPTRIASGICGTPVVMGSQLFLSGYQGAVSWGVCLNMVLRDGKITPETNYCDSKLQCNQFHTVSIVNGAVYGFGKSGQGEAMQCTDFKTGKLIWQQTGPDWNCKRQLIVADGLIFATTQHDELVLAEASKKGWHELGRVNPGIKMGLPQQPTLGGEGRLYLRGDDTIVCYQVGK